MRSNAQIEHLVLLEYEAGDRRARVERRADRWLVWCYGDGRRPYVRLERETSLKARQAAREWIEGRRHTGLLRRALGSGLLWASVALAAQAQPVDNPRAVQWEHGPGDYSETVRYEVGWYLGITAATPVQIQDVGRPTCAGLVGSPVVCEVPLPAAPAPGHWIVRVRDVRRVASDLERAGGWSLPSTPFFVCPVCPATATRCDLLAGWRDRWVLESLAQVAGPCVGCGPPTVGVVRVVE